MRHWMMAAAALGGLGLIGCSQQGAPSAPAAPAAGAPTTPTSVQPEAPAIVVPATSTADQVVTAFLNALRSGDKATTASLLTSRAREETARFNIDVDPQAAPNAQYSVRPAEILPNHPDGAHVRSVWAEKYTDEAGQEREVSYEIVWVLRRQVEGWRVAGMAAELIAGQPLQFLDFENPAEMLKKREEALSALQQPLAETAQQPQSPTPALPAPRTIER